MRWSADSVPTSLAVFWGEELVRAHGEPRARAADVPVVDYMAHAHGAAQRLEALAARVGETAARFRHWQTPWGEINRFQRLTGDIVQPFDDSKPSIRCRSRRQLGLAGLVRPDGRSRDTKTIYGDRGNSFVAAVEFGPRIRAKSILAGGQSGDPASPHFNDQAAMYARGEFKDVLFYKEDIEEQSRTEIPPGRINDT